MSDIDIHYQFICKKDNTPLNKHFQDWITTALATCYQEYAEITVRPICELEYRAVHRIEYRTHLSIGMRRHRPFPVVLRVAGLARLRGREPVLQEDLGVRVLLQFRRGRF